MEKSKVNFKTVDGVTIVGDYYKGVEGGPSALLLHMMPATKESWNDFAMKLLNKGYGHVLAIDLRGHGESTEGADGKKLAYELFEDEDHMMKERDVESAIIWLEDTHGVKKSRLAVIGASIGANLAIGIAADDAEIPAAVALSPGIDYRGVTTSDKVTAYDDHQGLYLAASVEDQLSHDTNNRLVRLRPGTSVKVFEGIEHGTDMFEVHPEFMDEVIDWLSGYVS